MPAPAGIRPDDGVTQPALPENAFRILIVCTANICRSPMAEHLLRTALDRRDRAARRIEVTSAGTRGFDGAPMDPPAAEQLRRLGGDPTEFRSRPLTGRLSEQADLILTATRAHRSFVLERVPRALRRTFTLREFAAAAAVVRQDQLGVTDLAELVRLAAAARGRVSLTDQEYDVPDPFGGPTETHRHVAEAIRQTTESIAAALLSEPER